MSLSTFILYLLTAPFLFLWEHKKKALALTLYFGVLGSAFFWLFKLFLAYSNTWWTIPIAAGLVVLSVAMGFPGGLLLWRLVQFIFRPFRILSKWVLRNVNEAIVELLQ